MSTNNENQNNLAEQYSLTWILNPLFMFFGKFDFYDETFSRMNLTICLLPAMFKIESQKKFNRNPKYLEKQKIMQNNFEAGETGIQYILNDNLENGFTILSITFIFSFYIAGSDSLGGEFYNTYDGKIPVFTQFLLNSIRLGPLDEKYYVSNIIINPFIRAVSAISPELVRPLDFLTIFSNFEIVIKWFKQLEYLFADNNFWFAHFVELQKTPLVSNQKLTLTTRSSSIQLML